MENAKLKGLKNIICLGIQRTKMWDFCKEEGFKAEAETPAFKTDFK